MVKISPSLLSANFACLDKEIKDIEQTKATWLHYDVMDGHFVPNISFGSSILNDINKITSLFLDVHLMISDPLYYVDSFIQSGADLITFHYEAVSATKIDRLIDTIKQKNVQVGISIKPNTPVDVLKPFLNKIDLVLVMSVEPGFGGQSFQDQAIDKIKQLAMLKKEHNFNYLIEVDGGINEVTGKLCKEAGCDVLVAGSYIFNHQDRNQMVDSLL